MLNYIEKLMILQLLSMYKGKNIKKNLDKVIKYYSKQSDFLA